MSTLVTRVVVMFAIFAMVAVGTTVSAQTTTDRSSDGLLKGAIAGSLVGAGLTVVGYGAMDDDVEAPAMSGPVAAGALAGAGAGALIGYLLDRAHKAPGVSGSGAARLNTVSPFAAASGHDSVANGVIIGAAIGAGLALADYAVDPSEPGNGTVAATAIGLGALLGAGIDALVHDDRGVTIAPALTRRTRALRVAVRF